MFCSFMERKTILKYLNQRIINTRETVLRWAEYFNVPEADIIGLKYAMGYITGQYRMDCEYCLDENPPKGFNTP